MSDSPLDRLQDEVLENGKDIRQLRTEMDEMIRWRATLSGNRGHMITWGIMLLAIVAEVIRSWGK